MEIKIGTQTIFKILYVIAWIIFVGLCVEAGGFLSNTVFTMIYTPAGAHKFWQEVDLNSLYTFDKGYFVILNLVIIIVTILKACLFYLIIKILHSKKLDFSQPFNKEVAKFITLVSYLALVIGLFSYGGGEYSEWFVKQGVNMPDVQHLRLGGADVWLFMSVTLFVILQIFKKGIEIQSENELTV